MQPSPFLNFINNENGSKPLSNYLEMFELIGNTPQEKAKYYEERCNQAFSSEEGRKVFDNYYKREYTYKVAFCSVRVIDGVSFGEIEYEPAYRLSPNKMQEQYDENTGE